MRRAEKLMKCFLETLESRGDVVPGAAGKIGRYLAPIDEAGEALEKTMEMLTGFGNAYVTPKGRRSLRAEVTSKFILDRVPMNPGSAEALFLEWAAELAEFKPGRQARLIAERLLSKEYGEHLDENPDETRDRIHRSRALAALRQFRYAFDLDLDLEALAKDWAKDLGPLPHHQACRLVARRIGTPEVANVVCRGGHPVHVLGSDERFLPLSFEEESELAQATEARVDAERAEASRENESLRRQLAEKDALIASLEAQLSGCEAMC